MKKKLPIRVLLILLCGAMLCGIPAYAVETRGSDRIDLSASTIGKTDDGRLSAYFMVRANDVMDVIGADSIEIQRHTIFGWVTEDTFTKEEFPELMTTNHSWHSCRVVYMPLFPGKTYRSVANIYVENAVGISTQSLASSPVT